MSGGIRWLLVGALALGSGIPALASAQETPDPKAAKAPKAKKGDAAKKGAPKADEAEMKPPMDPMGGPLGVVDRLDPESPLDQAEVLRFFRQARAREKAVNRKTEEAQRRIDRLGRMTADLEARYAALRVVQDELTTQLEAEKKREAKAKAEAEAAEKESAAAPDGPEREANIEQLSSVFNKMKPAKAAKVVARMDKSLVVEVLMRLKDRQAAKILAEVEPAVAAKLSQMMAERRDAEAAP